MRIAPGLALGACATLVIACGASQKASAPVTAETSAAGMSPSPPSADQRSEIDALDAEITAAFATLGLERPAPAALPALGCQPGVDCSPQTMSSGIEAPQTDPTCKPGASEICGTACTLADTVCSNASKICTIAGELGGGDAYANEKCDAGRSACDRASERCCSCM
jgi:hypothetical protein